jgi:hypothetical protein
MKTMEEKAQASENNSKIRQSRKTKNKKEKLHVKQNCHEAEEKSA